jgi:hypothetical protein
MACAQKRRNCSSKISELLCPKLYDLWNLMRGSKLPTRVTDVGKADGTEAPRLVRTKFLTTTMAHYSALSHCWSSSNMPLKTTLENLESHLTGFDELSLPKTFMDVITINRKLGIPYLWIDSLCIIQDNSR